MPTKPDEKAYDELVAAMTKHHNPVPSEIIQRYRFNSHSRKEGESVAIYLSELRALAEHCNFCNYLNNMLRDWLVCGIEKLRVLAEHCNFCNNLNDMLRDWLVCGIENKPIQKRLLALQRQTLRPCRVPVHGAVHKS